MEAVLLGLAAPAAVSTAGSLLERSLDTLSVPFSAILESMTDSESAATETSSITDIADLQSELANLQASLAARIQNALSSAGIKLDEPLQLRVSELDGTVEVVGNHQQKALIEAALADDPTFARDFAKALTMQQLVTASEQAEQATTDDDIALGIAHKEGQFGLFSLSEAGPSLLFSA
jgi:hypothetical protein